MAGKTKYEQIEGMKPCYGCKTLHPVSEFGRRTGSPDGLNKVCKKYRKRTEPSRTAQASKCPAQATEFCAPETAIEDSRKQAEQDAAADNALAIFTEQAPNVIAMIDRLRAMNKNQAGTIGHQMIEIMNLNEKIRGMERAGDAKELKDANFNLSKSIDILESQKNDIRKLADGYKLQIDEKNQQLKKLQIESGKLKAENSDLFVGGDTLKRIIEGLRAEATKREALLKPLETQVAKLQRENSELIEHSNNSAYKAKQLEEQLKEKTAVLEKIGNRSVDPALLVQLINENAELKTALIWHGQLKAAVTDLVIESDKSNTAAMAKERQALKRLLGWMGQDVKKLAVNLG